MPTTSPIPLDELPLKACAIVDQVDAGSDELERLMAMGVCTGRTVELVKRGDPLIIKVYGARLGVSARLARLVNVVPCGPESCCHLTSEEP
jgi:Fe2+ transport system protein FeoA